MTNYSKLSDTEIAEAVCKRLGAPTADEGYYPSLVWVTEQVPVHKDNFKYQRAEDKEDRTRKELLRSICFDWPAPIMMQKVKEDLRRFGCETCRNNGIRGFEVAVGYREGITVSSISEPRALYEAYLEVTE